MGTVVIVIRLILDASHILYKVAPDEIVKV